MTSIKFVLVATELSADGINTVHRAARLARECGAHLHLLHVLAASGRKPLRDRLCPPTAPGVTAALARRALRRLAGELAGAYDLVPTVEVVAGDAPQSLLQGAERADLLVLGQGGPGLLRAFLTGRTVDRLITGCRRPVLVVKTPVRQAYRQILLPIDFETCSEAAIRMAAGLKGDAGVQVFHAVESQRYAMLREADVPEHIIREARAMEEAGIKARMRRRVARLGLHGESVSFALRPGPAVNTALSQAQALGADLLVTGRLGRSGWEGLLRGSVSRRLLSGARCDVLIVPAAPGAITPARSPPP